MHYGLAAQRRAHSAWRRVSGTGSQYFTYNNLPEHTKTRSALCALRLPLTLLIDIAILSKKSNSKRGYGSGQLQRL